MTSHDTEDASVRIARAQDETGIADLIARCPEVGVVSVGYRLVGPISALSGRFQTRRMHVAESGGGLVGMIFTDIADVLVGGRIVRAARLSYLRTDPAFRGRGIAKALMRTAERDAETIDRVEVLWGHIIAGNRASHATCAAVGYGRAQSGAHKLVDPLRCAAPHAGARIRPGQDADLPWLVSTLNERYDGYDFWRPLSVEDYQRFLLQWQETGGRPELWLATDGENRPLAAALAYGNPHALAASVLRMNPWLRLVNAFVRLPIKLGAPLRITTMADVVTARAAPREAVVNVVRHAVRSQRGGADFVLLMRHAGETATAAYQAVRGVSSPVDVVCKRWAASGRPLYIEPW